MTSDWPLPPTTWTLEDNEIHVWVADLGLPPEKQTVCERVLSMEETERARRFHFERDRLRYIATHGILRFLLGRYLAGEPAQVCLAADSYGKPHVVTETDVPLLHFNLSHSAGLALYVLTRNRRIGVDVEKIRPDIATADIAASYFSGGEARNLRALPKEQQLEAFFICWTRKEAYLKARGCGLSRPLGEFEVSFLPGEPPAILRAPDDPQAGERWAAMHLTPAPGYVGAVVVEGRDLFLKCWQWQFHVTGTVVPHSAG